MIKFDDLTKENIKEHNLNWPQPSKHSSWWRRTENVLKKSWICLQCNTFFVFQDVFKTFQDIISRRHHEDVFKRTSCKHVLKTSWKMSCEDVFKMCCEDVFKMSWRCLDNLLGDVLEDEQLVLTKKQ